ncbi:MAG: Ycf66 family protein [Microcoleus sp.]
MVNLGLNWSSLLGIILAVAGAGLYFLRSWRPKLARDHDIFFAAVGLLCGGILLFQGWRLDPILAFGQFLLTGAAIFFAAESIKLRGATTAQAKNRAQYIDEDRPVSNAYAYDGYDYDNEVERIEPEEDYPQRPRIRGSQDYRSSREAYDDEPRRRPSGRSSNNTSDREPSERPSRKRSSRSDSPAAPPRDNWNVSDEPEERPVRSRNGRPPTSENPNPDAPARKKKNRPPEASRSRSTSRDVDAPPSDYVEYRPVEYPEDQPENSTDFNK